MERVAIDPARWRPTARAPLPEDAVVEIAEALTEARRPVVVTSYLGRGPTAVEALETLCRSVGVGVIESAPSSMNLPVDSDFYLGSQWNEPFPTPALAQADVILVIDSDIPWIGAVNPAPAEAAIYHIDVDPLKETIPLWYIGARRSFRADAGIALAQLNAHLAASGAAGTRGRAGAALCKTAQGARRFARAEGDRRRRSHQRIPHRQCAAAYRRGCCSAQRGRQPLPGNSTSFRS